MARSDCNECDSLRDRVGQLEAILDPLVRDERWLGSNIAVEFSRIARGAKVPYLYVHCSPAWGETPEEYEARYRRVREAEKSKRRSRYRSGEVRVRANVVLA